MFLSKDAALTAGRTQNKKSKNAVPADRSANMGHNSSFDAGTADATKPSPRAVKDMTGARSTNKAHKNAFADCE